MGFLRRIKDALDPDRVLQEVMNGFIEAAAVKRALDRDQHVWTPGEALKLIFAGYVGTRNTGADVRVEEMIRQIRWVVGDQRSTVMWDSIAAVIAIHGHDGATRVVWMDK